MIACGKYSLAHFGPHSENCASLLEGYMTDYEPQGKQRYCQASEVTPEVVNDMRATIKETCFEKLFTASVTADDTAEMIARGKFSLDHFGPHSENCASLVEGYMTGGTTVNAPRRNFPDWKEKYDYMDLAAGPLATEEGAAAATHK